jgi:AcrR family transcriptional regulator
MTTESQPSPRRKSAPARERGNGRKPALGREAWLNAAREALIREGIRAVEVGKLARRLKVTRGGFYWFFDSRRQLLDELLADWERTNTRAFKATIQDPRHNGMAEFRAIVDMWVDERGYSPAWDAAIRDWARVSPKVATAVRRVDDERIAILKQIFLDMGDADEEAFVRARITYFHQVGYYTLGVKEPREQRLHLLPLYIRFLSGR